MANPPYSGDRAGDALGWTPARSVRSAGLRDEAARRGDRRHRPDAAASDDGWSQSTWSGAGRAPAPPRTGRPTDTRVDSGWQASAWTGGGWSDDGTPDQAVHERPARAGTHPAERGLPSWLALVVLLVIAGIGGIIDMLSGTQVRGGFNVGIVLASVVAILVVRRSGMFPIVIAPPIVYSVASGAMVYLRSGGLSDHKALYDAAANWLVYGFPAIACATAAVLIVAGVRMIIRR